ESEQVGDRARPHRRPRVGREPGIVERAELLEARGGGDPELLERVGTAPAAARLDPPLVRRPDLVLHVREVLGPVLARERITVDETFERGDVHEVVLYRPA